MVPERNTETTKEIKKMAKKATTRAAKATKKVVHPVITSGAVIEALYNNEQVYVTWLPQAPMEQTRALSTWVESSWYQGLAERYQQQEEPETGTKWVEEPVTKVGDKKVPDGYTVLYKTLNGQQVKDTPVEVYFNGTYINSSISVLGAKRVVYRHIGALKLPDGYTIKVEVNDNVKRYCPQLQGEGLFYHGKRLASKLLEDAENSVFNHYKKQTSKDFPIESAK